MAEQKSDDHFDELLPPDETVPGAPDPGETVDSTSDPLETAPGSGLPEETFTAEVTAPLEIVSDAGTSAFDTVIGDPQVADSDTVLEEGEATTGTAPTDAGDSTGSTIVTEVIEEQPAEAEPVAARATSAPKAAVLPPPSDLVPLERKRPKSDAWTLFLIFAFVIFGAAIYLTAKELYDIYHVRFGVLSQEADLEEEEEEAPVAAPATPDAKPGTPEAKPEEPKKEGEGAKPPEEAKPPEGEKKEGEPKKDDEKEGGWEKQ